MQSGSLDLGAIKAQDRGHENLLAGADGHCPDPPSPATGFPCAKLIHTCAGHSRMGTSAPDDDPALTKTDTQSVARRIESLGGRSQSLYTHTGPAHGRSRTGNQRRLRPGSSNSRGLSSRAVGENPTGLGSESAFAETRSRSTYPGQQRKNEPLPACIAAWNRAANSAPHIAVIVRLREDAKPGTTPPSGQGKDCPSRRSPDA